MKSSQGKSSSGISQSALGCAEILGSTVATSISCCILSLHLDCWPGLFSAWRFCLLPSNFSRIQEWMRCNLSATQRRAPRPPSLEHPPWCGARAAGGSPVEKAAVVEAAELHIHGKNGRAAHVLRKNIWATVSILHTFT